MKREKREVFVADDGSVFDKEDDCIAHEKELAALAKRIEGLKVYAVNHGFDGTEGRGYFARTWIITDQEYAIVLAHCIRKFGAVLQDWYGDGFYVAWRLSESDFSPEQAIEKIGFKASRNHRPDELVFISRKKLEYPGLPDPMFPWPPEKSNG